MVRLLAVGVFFSPLLGSIGICLAQADASPSSSMISGTVTYLVRMALPPDAGIDVRLEDVSRAETPATFVAENIFAAAGKQAPIPSSFPTHQKTFNPIIDTASGPV